MRGSRGQSAARVYRSTIARSVARAEFTHRRQLPVQDKVDRGVLCGAGIVEVGVGGVAVIAEVRWEEPEAGATRGVARPPAAVGKVADNDRRRVARIEGNPYRYAMNDVRDLGGEVGDISGVLLRCRKNRKCRFCALPTTARGRGSSSGPTQVGGRGEDLLGGVGDRRVDEPLLAQRRILGSSGQLAAGSYCSRMARSVARAELARPG